MPHRVESVCPVKLLAAPIIAPGGRRFSRRPSAAFRFAQPSDCPKNRRSPHQFAGRLAGQFITNQRRRVSDEANYGRLSIQNRGVLNRNYLLRSFPTHGAPVA